MFLRPYNRLYFYKQPKTTIKSLNMTYLGPIIRGTAPVKPFDINLNVNIRTLVNNH